jgi:adenine-specific DNA-methyltransferase
MAKAPNKLTVETLTHDEATRKNIPTAEYQSVLRQDEQSPIRVAYERRNRDLDPQLVWRGKDQQDWSDLVVHAPPIYIQEKVHPKVLIDDLLKHPSPSGRGAGGEGDPDQIDLFANFNGLPNDNAKTEFYQHDAHWANRMILGDSLQVMASLAEREGLRGKVQCIYFDPPYGIKFNSNFQWSTTSRDVKDGNVEHITREPEQVKAFRDTWRDGIHSYLTYLRDRLTVARDLLTESGSIFVQIGDENVHRVRAVMDEVFGEANYISTINFSTTGGLPSAHLSRIGDFILLYAKDKSQVKWRRMKERKKGLGEEGSGYNRIEQEPFVRRPATPEEKENAGVLSADWRVYSSDNLNGQGPPPEPTPFEHDGKTYHPSPNSHWKPNYPNGLKRLARGSRVEVVGNNLRYVRYFDDNPSSPIKNIWLDTSKAGFASEKAYVVETNASVVERCILMTTDPGDLVLDPTCGSGTTAYVAEQWGRRWITIDTSRVALALARARIMGARYPYYLLADSRDGQLKEAEITRTALPSPLPLSQRERGEKWRGDIRQGFVYERVPHITLKSIANNAEIDVIWEAWQPKVQDALARLNAALRGHNKPFKVTNGGRAGKTVQFDAPDDATFTMPSGEIVPAFALVDWEVPREALADWPETAHKPLADFWEARIARQKEIDASIAAKAEFEYLYDKPYEDKKKVRVAGPFTVESLSPHRVLTVDENDELIDDIAEPDGAYSEERDFVQMILENLKTAGVQQAHKDDKINFTSLTPWPGELICAEGRFVVDSDEWLVDSKTQLATNHSPLSAEKRAAIFIGPEFGTVSRPDLVAAAREAGDAGFDVLIACAFNYDAHSSEFNKLGRIPILKARMNADLHMADDLKNTGKGNLFVIFGEPDIEVASEEWLVDSRGNRVAPYDIFKLVSGVDRLAEINGLDRKDLWDYARVSNRGEIWDYIANAAGVDIHSSQYRRRTGTENNGGVSAIAWHCAGITRRTGNVSDLIRKAGVSSDPGFRALVERLRRDQQNAPRPDENAVYSPLTTIHYSQVTIHGVDVFHPNTGEVRSDGAEGIACWFIDTEYNEESFFVRHAYFLGANDPYKALKTTLKAEINEEAWATLNSDTSRPFEKPKSGRIAVKVINHLGDEVMKVFKVG